MARQLIGAWIGSSLLLICLAGCREPTAHEDWVEPTNAAATHGGPELSAYEDPALPPGARLIFRFLDAATSQEHGKPTAAVTVNASVPASPR